MQSTSSESDTAARDRPGVEREFRMRETRPSWPRYEPGFTHFELGASADSRPTAVMAKRYTPRYGVRQE
jgi:hypothetical protein